MDNKGMMAKLHKLSGAVPSRGRRDPFATVLRSPSPSVNFIFGKNHGIPLGNSAVFYGIPKSGKSILANAFIGQMHKDNANAIAIKFNTEMREEAQLTEKDMATWGIDPDRYVAYETNDPVLVFDRIAKDINSLCQENPGAVQLVVIDSINSIMGRRMQNADSTMAMQIGDLALTLQDGFKGILQCQRANRFAVILVAQARAEMDQAEQMRGNKMKMAASFSTKHYAEYFISVEPNLAKAGRTDLSGNLLEDKSVKDLMDHAERTGHKIRVAMKDSSLGPKGRVGEFTLDYHRGIINVHEEVFLLGVNRGILERPNQLTYQFEGVKWAGKDATVKAIRDSYELQQKILTKLRERDLNGDFAGEDARTAESESDTLESDV